MNHLGTVTLTTDRLTLRRFDPRDAQAVFDNWASDPEVTRFLTWPAHPDVEESARVLEMWCDSYGDPSFYQWAIVANEIGQPVGSISVVRSDDQAGEAEIGYCIGRRWWGMGITSEALAAVIDFLFDKVGAARVAALHATENPRSGAVMRRCGMTFEGILRKTTVSNSGISDAAHYAILREDWLARRRMAELHADQTTDHPLGTKTAQDSLTIATHLLRHEDINGANRLFGGRLMEWIDDAAGIAAIRHCGCDVTTACVDTLEFRHPAFLDDIVVIEARVTFVGRSSLEVQVDSYVEAKDSGQRTLVNKAYLTEVCVDERGRSRVIPYGLALSTADEWTTWEAALFRKEMHSARRDSGI